MTKKIALLSILEQKLDREDKRLLERDVHEHLAANLNLLQVPGLTLVQTEYQTEVGRVDILATLNTDTYVAIEVKRGTAFDRDIGQLTKYIGSLYIEFPNCKILGLLVARRLSPEARASLVATAPDIAYFEFTLNFDYARIRTERSPDQWPLKPPPPPALPPPPTPSEPVELPPFQYAIRHCPECETMREARFINGWTFRCLTCGKSI